MVENKLSKLKTNKSSRPDGFHSNILKESASSIGLPLSILYNMSLTEGHVPHAWKEWNITPIYKKGSKTDAGNYRPVSLTSILGKVMESFIRDHLVDHMTRNKLLCEAQHGFVPGRSCVTQLLITLELWTEILDSGGLQTTQPTSGGAVTTDSSCCANSVEPPRPQQWGPDLPFFGNADPLDGWLCCSQKRVMSRPIQVQQL